MYKRKERTAVAAASIIRLLFLAAVLLASAACTGPLQVTYKPVAEKEPFKVKEPATVVINRFTDARTDIDASTGPRRIGRISTTVTDMINRSLILADDVPAIVEDAYVKEFTAAGYTVKPAAEDAAGADYILSGEITRFTLNIEDRDRIEIAVNEKLTDAKTGSVVWAGTEAVKDDRFAGVSGNSRSTIAAYIVRNLSKVAKKTVAEASARIASMKEAARPVKNEVSETGKIVITTTPARSKVYINDVYYGLAPLEVEIEPGIYTLSLRLPGFKNGTEKVAVRKGHSTEVEIILDKE